MKVDPDLQLEVVNKLLSADNTKCKEEINFDVGKVKTELNSTNQEASVNEVNSAIGVKQELGEEGTSRTSESDGVDKWKAAAVYSCATCLQSFTKRYDLRAHETRVHPTRHCCDICSKSFASNLGLTGLPLL